MTIDMIEKITKRAEKFHKIIDKISPRELEELRKLNAKVDKLCRQISDILGSSNPYWRIHPIYPNIRCSINGEIEISGTPIEVREFSGKLMVCFDGSRKKLPAANLVLECFDPCPGNRSDYQIQYIDMDYKNIKPSNLRWKRIIVR